VVNVPVPPSESSVLRSRDSHRKISTVKKSRFTDSQIIDALKQAEAGLTVPEFCRELGTNSTTLYKWWAKFGGMDASLMARMKELEQENQRLRKMYVEERLKAEIVSEALAKRFAKNGCPSIIGAT
jgi:putative transposase